MAARRWSVNRQDLGTVLGSSKDFLGLGLGLRLGFLSSGRRSTMPPVRKRPCRPYKSVDSTIDYLNYATGCVV